MTGGTVEHRIPTLLSFSRVSGNRPKRISGFVFPQEEWFAFAGVISSFQDAFFCSRIFFGRPTEVPIVDVVINVPIIDQRRSYNWTLRAIFGYVGSPITDRILAFVFLFFVSGFDF